ncbi:MAG: sugar ABC transporter permease, partial [Butyrivibrio sp.]|nr:sugar ABC transporter permease [Butyrivibrio sp.]
MKTFSNIREGVADLGEKVNKLLRKNAADKISGTESRGRAYRSKSRIKIKRSKKETRKIVRETVTSWIFLSPSLIGVLTFFVVPFIVVLYYSVVNNPIQKEFIGFYNFTRVFNNDAFRLAAGNTFKFSVVAVPLAVSLSLLLAVVMESGIPFKSQFRSFFLSPMMVPIASIVLIWQVLFDFNGLFNQFYTLFGNNKVDWLKSEHAQVVIVFLFLWKNL